LADQIVLDIDVNDEKFKRFSTLFEQYSESLKKTVADWESVNKQIGAANSNLRQATGSQDKRQSAVTDDMRRAEQVRRGGVGGGKKPEEDISAISRSFDEMLKKTNAVHKSMREITSSFGDLRKVASPTGPLWQAVQREGISGVMRSFLALSLSPIGMIGAGVTVGFSGFLAGITAAIANAAGTAQQRLQSFQLNVPQSRIDSYKAQFSGFTPDPTQMLGAAETARQYQNSDQMKMMRFLFKGRADAELRKGLTAPGQMTADIMRELDIAQKKSHVNLGTFMKNFGAGGELVGGVEGERRWQTMSDKERKEFTAGLTKEDVEAQKNAAKVDQYGENANKLNIALMDFSAKMTLIGERFLDPFTQIAIGFVDGINSALQKLLDMKEWLTLGVGNAGVKPGTKPMTPEEAQKDKALRIQHPELYDPKTGEKKNATETGHASWTPGPTSLAISGGADPGAMKQWFQSESQATRDASKAAANRDNNITRLLDWLIKRADKSDQVSQDLIDLTKAMENGAFGGGGGGGGAPESIRRRGTMGGGIAGGGVGKEGGGGGGAGIGNYGPSTLTGDAKVDAVLKTIRTRESGGNYGIWNKSGASASGGYQFMRGTWQNLTKKYGIGGQYANAADAPAAVQDAVAGAYVKDILKQSGGDVSKVPLAWYTGNIQGKLSAAAIAANKGLTPGAYQAGWMKTFNKLGGGAAETAAADVPSKDATDKAMMLSGAGGGFKIPGTDDSSGFTGPSAAASAAPREPWRSQGPRSDDADVYGAVHPNRRRRQQRLANWPPLPPHMQGRGLAGAPMPPEKPAALGGAGLPTPPRRPTDKELAASPDKALPGVPNATAAFNDVKSRFPHLSNEQCVALVQAYNGVGNVHDWRKGASVAGGTLTPGTAIATFMGPGYKQSDRYAGGGSGTPGIHRDHAAVFLGYDKDQKGNITGMKVAEQYSGSGGVHMKTYPMQGEGERGAANYFAIAGQKGHGGIGSDAVAGGTAAAGAPGGGGGGGGAAASLPYGNTGCCCGGSSGGGGTMGGAGGGLGGIASMIGGMLGGSRGSALGGMAGNLAGMLGGAMGQGGPLHMGNWQDPNRHHGRLSISNNIGADIAVGLATLGGH
jgi:hypothetical protein